MSNEVTLIVKEAGDVVVLSNVLVGLPGRAGADWSQIQNKPATFPPSTHTHTASQITDFAAAVVAAAPPTTNASLLTSGTLADARLSATVAASLAKAETASQPGHGHAISEVSGLQAAITAEETARIAGDTALDTKITAETTARTTALSTKADLVSGKVPAGQLTTFTYGQPGIVPNSFGSDAGKFLKGDGNWTLPTTSDVVGLDTALAGKQPAGSYAPASGIAPSAIEGTAVVTTDARLSDARTPLSHDHTASQITDFANAVAAAAPAPTTSANSGLAITGNALATSYNTSIADSVVSVPVGGAPAAAASSWKTKNLVQVLDDILFPTLIASVGTGKSVNLTVSGSSGTLEIGSSHSRTLTADFNRGTITNGNGSTNANPLVGPATTYTFTGTGISSTAQAGNTLSFTTAVVSGSNNWAVTVAHSAGTGTYTDNKGVLGTNLDASRAAGSTTDSTSSPTITGVHPYYYLKSASPITTASMVAAIQNGTATKVVASSTGTLSIPYAPTAEYFAVAYPSTSTTKTRYFVTALDNGAITVVFAPVTSQSVTTALWTQDYRIHVSTAALTNSNPTIELRNT